MNNKKNKSKSRGKLTKTTQETENVTEKIDEIVMVNPESLNTDETRVPEIETESITVPENFQSTNDFPKKPKRSKGKKKKESLFEDMKVKEDNDESTKDVKAVSENIVNITEENIQTTPSVRKKKKKSKKHDENSECVNVTEVENTDKDSHQEKSLGLEKNESVPVNVQVLSENVDVVHKDDVLCRKKKKKKPRTDSEKSDRYDPCTLAFQKLIEPPNEVDKGDDSLEIQQKEDNKIITKTVVELQEVQDTNLNPVYEEIKAGGTTIKKKNKKGKKKPPEEHNICVETVKGSTPEKNIRNTSENELLTAEKRESEETSPKPKAKIAKPVQKKRQNKPESESQKTINDANLEMNTSENIKIDVLKENEIKENPNTVENKHTESSVIDMFNSDTDNINVIQSSQCQLFKQEMNESEDPSMLIYISENKQEQEISSKTCDELGFVEVNATKGKKKRNKNVITPDTPETIQIKSLEAEKDTRKDTKCTESKDQKKSEQMERHNIIIPDMIEYPRSTSQQFIDSNNNTYIQEITPTEEVKLGSPFCIATPIIQGSGESPEAKARNDPVVINVTEIDSQHSSSNVEIALHSEEKQTPEKTDIKSKMIEVNRDMEELRRSIEKSLAELTAIDKSDTEVEKEFEKLFQSQNEVQLPTEVTDSFVNVSLQKRDTKDIENSKTTNQNLQSTATEIPKDNDNTKHKNVADIHDIPPVCPARRDKSKNKSKKKGKKDVVTTVTNIPMTSEIQTASGEKDTNQKSEKSTEKSETTQEKGKQQTLGGQKDSETSKNSDMSFEPIENFEDALTSSGDDINLNFEVIVKDTIEPLNSTQHHSNPEINIISPVEDTEGKNIQNASSVTKEKKNPISRPKNLLGHPNIPASSNKTDFKKEKSNPPNSIQAKVKIKDSVEIEKITNKKSQTDNDKELTKESNGVDSTFLMKTNEDLIYKYSFRKVFLQSICHVCKKDLVHRVSCKFCSSVFYCSQKHKDEDWTHHQSLCFALSTIAHLKEQKYIYADAQNVLDHSYRVLRMQTILSCEKVLNRKLVPWEQEALLYPRICADVKCRQWKQEQLKDCAGCGQISYCINHPEHLPLSHQRWCKSYSLYQRLVNYQLAKGRLEPPLPSRVLNHYIIPGKLNDVLGSMYEEKIDMDDIQYAALTQIATAPLTAAYSYQIYSSKTNSTCANGVKKNSTFTIHTVGAELPFEADSLNKWERFFLHLRSDVQDLRVVMVGPDINSSKLPLDLLAKIKLCHNCHTNKRRVLFDFHENESYHDYYLSDGFVTPDIVCAFNPNIHRSSAYNVETWPSTINSILKQRVPFVLTSYSIEELRRDLGKVRECTTIDFNVLSEIKYNPFGSVRPDRNFITDHEIPLLFKNYCFCILRGTL